VAGGPHTTLCPEFIKHPAIDWGIIGEADDAIVELADAIESGNPAESIANLRYARNGRILTNPMRPLRDPSDLLPPDRESLYQWNTAQENPWRTFIGTRGCPFRCAYCANNSLSKLYQGKGSWFRARNPHLYAEEIREVFQKHHGRQAWLVDDVVNADNDWFEIIFEHYRRDVHKPFVANIKPDLVTADQVRILSDSGCVSVGMGLESGSREIRASLLNRQESNEALLDACKKLKDAGIFIIAQCILGIPGTTLEDDLRTLDLHAKARPGYSWASLFNPYPGLPLTNKAIEQGLFDGDFDSLGATYHIGTPLKLPHRKKLVRLQRLFSVASQSSWLRAFLPVLTTLPLGLVYSAVRKLHKGYALSRGLIRYRFGFREIVVSIARFLSGRGG
jgi:anaerobic magnesium-protoporphyrin IX monomethyl ester cyclase